MNVSPTTDSPLTVRTAPVFTLGSALRWLGHDCADHRCSKPIDALPISMWFRWHGHSFPTYPLQAWLVVYLAEAGEPLARAHRLIDEVDRCTRGETIWVHRRYSDDSGQHLIARQMDQTPPVWCSPGCREENVGQV